MAESGKNNLIPAERQDRIVCLVHAQGSASVSELAKIFDVTTETIRRDLAVLDEGGRLLRRRGGAVGTKVADRDRPWVERRIDYIEEKTGIALEAVKCIDEGDAVFFDASTTVYQLAKVMPDIRLTAITNSQVVAGELATRNQINVIVIGGNFDRTHAGCYGPHAERMLRAYQTDKAFLSCHGIHMDRGITDVDETIAQLRATMISQASAPYLLADHTKFESVSLCIVSEISAFHQIITDDSVDPNVVKAFEERNLPLVVAPPAHINVAQA